MDRIKYLKANWLTKRVSVLARKLKMEEPAVRRLAVRLKLGKRVPIESRKPSQKQIRKRAAAVRAQWSPEEKAKRFVGGRRRKDWTVPVVKVRDVFPGAIA